MDSSSKDHGASFRHSRRVWVTLGVLCGVAFACTGCDAVKNLWRTPEERINEAFPPNGDVALAKAKYESLIGADGKEKTSFEDEYDNKQKLRALECAGPFKPSAMQSASDIRAALKAECFAEADKKTVQWITSRRVHLLLAAPPLRPIPQTPRQIITAARPIRSASFADDAGVGLFSSGDSIEIVDLGTDDSIYQDLQVKPYVINASISPNGRVFAVLQNRSSDGNVLSLRAAEDGEELTTFSGISRFQWLDANTAWITKSTGGSFLLNLRNGEEIPLKGMSTVPLQVLRVHGNDADFIAGGMSQVSRFRLADEPTPHATLLDQGPIHTQSWSDAQCAMTADGTYIVQGAGSLNVINTKTLENQEISLQPFSTSGIYPFPGTTHVLISVSVANYSQQRYFIFDASDQTFSPIEDPILETARNNSNRTFYITPIRQVALNNGSSLKVFDDLKHGFKLGVQAFIQHLQEQDSLALSEQNRTNLQAMSGIGNSNSPGARAVGDIPELAKDAQIEAVGVYESAFSSHRAMGTHPAGPVSVRVMKGKTPIILVLSSYEPVTWRLSVDPRAELRAVLLSSNQESTVSGASGIRTVNIGQHYAYKQESLGELQRDVLRWTGRNIDMFQGAYSGTQFTVGH